MRQKYRSCRSSGGKTVPLERKDLRVISTAKGKSFGYRQQAWDPELHSATPELLNSCNSFLYVSI
jgi:hypothetical protein